jgi:pyrroloquinoline quinone biosynthesis protein D
VGVIETDRDRAIADELSRPYLRRHVRLRFDAIRNKHVVLAPEKLLWPDEIGVRILTLCDGDHTVGEIADRLTGEYDAPREVILGDVLEFVQEWSDRLLLKLE